MALDGACSLAEAIEKVKTASRHLAKRQLTWFRRDSRVKWIPAEGKSAETIAREIACDIEKELET